MLNANIKTVKVERTVGGWVIAGKDEGGSWRLGVKGKDIICRSYREAEGLVRKLGWKVEE